jgi:cell division protein FtsQ
VTSGNRRVARPSIPPELAAPDVAQAPPPVPRTPSRFFAVARTVLGVALVVASAAGLAWALRRHITTSPRFAVAHFEVTGNDRLAADAVGAQSGIALGGNVFAVDLDAARARLLANPWIANATLARRLPGTIVVQLTERRAAALVAMGDTLLVTPEGEPFKRLEPGDPVDLPLVTGLDADTFAADRAGATRTVRRAIDLAAEYAHGPLARRSPLEEVHVDPGGAFQLVVGHGAMQLALGGPPFRRKLDEAARVVAELDKRGARAGAIMLDNEARPERVVVRLR